MTYHSSSAPRALPCSSVDLGDQIRMGNRTTVYEVTGVGPSALPGSVCLTLEANGEGFDIDMRPSTRVTVIRKAAGA